MAGIIRRDRVPSAAVLALPDIEAEATQILADARAAAREMIAAAREQARTEATRIAAEVHARNAADGRRTGHEQALQEGRAAALAQSRAQLGTLADTLSAAVREYETSKHALLAAAESGLIELALAIARRVCTRLAVADPEVARANAHALLEMVQHRGDLELHLHPTQCDQLAETVTAFVQDVDKARHVRVIADPALSPGDCRLVAGDGQIDAAIDAQLDRVAASLCPHEPHQAHPTEG